MTKLNEALVHSVEEKLLQYEQLSYECKFSKDFESKMNRLIKFGTENKRKSKLYIRYILIAAVLFVAAALSFTVYANLDSIGRFFVSNFGTYSSVIVSDSRGFKESFEELYVLDETSGFVLVSSDKISSIMTLVYGNADGKPAVFSQCLGVNYTSTVNTEGFEIETVLINGEDGIFIDMGGISYLQWCENGYIFSIAVNIDKQQALNLVNYTKIK